MATLIHTVFQALYWALMIRILLSWIPHDRYHPAVEFLYRITDPILEPFRRLIPTVSGIDFSPIVAFFALGIVRDFLLRILL